MKKNISFTFFSLLVAWQASASEPAQWHENDWIKFIDAAVWGSLGDAYTSVGGRFPLVDTYAALSASASAVKPGLQLWLRTKMADAYTEGNFEQGDRYNAFYSCLTWGSCEELRKIERQAQGSSVAAVSVDYSGCTNDEVATLRKLGFSEQEMASLCRPATMQDLQDAVTGSFSGSWQTSWGMMTLNAGGSGSYTHDKGKITGSVNGRILTGTWSEAPSYSPPNDAGDIEFTLSEDGNSWSGKWRYGSEGSWKSDWSGTRVE